MSFNNSNSNSTSPYSNMYSYQNPNTASHSSPTPPTHQPGTFVDMPTNVTSSVSPSYSRNRRSSPQNRQNDFNYPDDQDPANEAPIQHPNYDSVSSNNSSAVPLLTTVSNDHSRLRQNAVEDLGDVANLSSRLFCISICLGLAELITSIVLLAITWYDTCDQPLQTWVVVFSGRLVILLPIAMKRYSIARTERTRNPNSNNNSRRDSLSNLNNNSFGNEDNMYNNDGELIQGLDSQIASQNLRRIKRYIDLAVTIWWFIGQLWFFRPNDCLDENPILYKYALTLIILAYVQLLLPLILLFMLCLCLPLAMILVLWLAPSPGAAPSNINALPTRSYQMPANPLPSGEELPTCSICMEEYRQNDELRILPCNHEFHKDCVQTWLLLKASCPLCRASILPNNENDAENAHADRSASANNENRPFRLNDDTNDRMINIRIAS